jgi:TPR repeat protein
MRVAAMLAALILVSSGSLDKGFAQTAPSAPAATTARELVRKGREVFNREDYPAALELFRSAAEQGDAEAQVWVGLIYLNGWGVKKNYAEALTWLQKSAAQGFASAQGRIGSMYKRGWGVPQNDAEAVLWYRKAAEGGDTDAQNVIGLAYALGEGVPKDYVRALSWSERPLKRTIRRDRQTSAQCIATALGLRRTTPWPAPGIDARPKRDTRTPKRN